MERDIEEERKKLYYEGKDPGSNAAVGKRGRSGSKGVLLGVTRDQVENFLSEELSYSLPKAARQNILRIPTYVKGIDHQ